MNQPAKKGKNQKERIVCFCYSVPEQVIVAAIENGCSSLMDIRRETYASTGCAGCSEEIKKLLKKNFKKQQQQAAAPIVPPKKDDEGKPNG